MIGANIKKKMPFTIFWGSQTGNTEEIASALSLKLPDSETIDVSEIDSADVFCKDHPIVCCVPTWNTGADEERSGTAWDDFVGEIKQLEMNGRYVACVGLGDSAAYSDNFCEAMEEIYSAFKEAGAKMIGRVSTEGYTFNESKSVENGEFCGLPIDEINESELTEERVDNWIKKIMKEIE